MDIKKTINKKIILLIAILILAIVFAFNWPSFSKGFMAGWNSVDSAKAAKSGAVIGANAGAKLSTSK